MDEVRKGDGRERERERERARASENDRAANTRAGGWRGSAEGRGRRRSGVAQPSSVQWVDGWMGSMVWAHAGARVGLVRATRTDLHLSYSHTAQLK